MDGGKWIYPLLILAVYLFRAYTASQKKAEQKNNPKPNAEKQPSKPITDPFPNYKPQPQQGRDIFKEIFTGEQPRLPKPAVQTIPQRKPVLKPVAKPKREPTVLTSSTVREVQKPDVDIHSDSLTQANDAYSFKTEGDAYVFHAREAFISSIIFNRPDY